MKQLLHTPEGVRDIYNVECGKKLSLESRLHKVLQLYGYHDIQTPTFEYFDSSSDKEIGTIPYKRSCTSSFEQGGEHAGAPPGFYAFHRKGGFHVLYGGGISDPAVVSGKQFL